MKLVFPVRCARREHRIDIIEKAGPRVGQKAVKKGRQWKRRGWKIIFYPM